MNVYLVEMNHRYTVEGLNLWSIQGRLTTDTVRRQTVKCIPRETNHVYTFEERNH